MAHAFLVRVPHMGKDHNGNPRMYQKGDIIGHPDHVATVKSSEHRAFGHSVHLPDHHPAILAHLPEEHPAMSDYMTRVRLGQR